MLRTQVRWGLVKPGYGLLRLLHRLLGKQLLQACEVAMEYLLALTHSPQVRNASEAVCHFGLCRMADVVWLQWVLTVFGEAMLSACCVAEKIVTPVSAI